MIDEALTHDGFLGGRICVWQPATGYRSGNDPVLLAASCPAQSGDSVLELGCGVGVASLCLGMRVSGLTLTGVEREEAYAALARRNAAEAGIGLVVISADLTDLPEPVRQLSFDHVLANPPYFRAGAGSASDSSGREAGRREATPLRDWIDVARRRLRPKGWLTMIQQAERLPDCLQAMDGFGAITVLPLQPRTGRPAGRVLIRARKGARGAFRLLAPILIHESEHHDGDRDSYGAPVAAVLREGAALPWP